MLFGVTVFAYITGTVSYLLTSFNAQSKRLTEHQYQLDGFCRAHGIPKALGEKMMQYYAYVLPRKVHTDDQAIISGLSGSLRCQVCLSHIAANYVLLNAKFRSRHRFFMPDPLKGRNIDFLCS